MNKFLDKYFYYYFYNLENISAAIFLLRWLKIVTILVPQQPNKK